MPASTNNNLDTLPQELLDNTLGHLLVTDHGGIAKVNKKLSTKVPNYHAQGKVLVLRGEGNSYRMIKSRDTDLAHVTDLTVVHLSPIDTDTYPNAVFGDKSLFSTFNNGPRLSASLDSMGQLKDTSGVADREPVPFRIVDYVTGLVTYGKMAPDYQPDAFRSSLIVERNMRGDPYRFLLYPAPKRDLASRSLPGGTTASAPLGRPDEHIFVAQLKEYTEAEYDEEPWIQVAHLAQKTLLTSDNRATGLHFTLVDPLRWGLSRTMEEAGQYFRNKVIDDARASIHRAGILDGSPPAMSSEDCGQYVTDHLHFMSREDFLKTSEGRTVSDYLQGDGDRSRYSTTDPAPSASGA